MIKAKANEVCVAKRAFLAFLVTLVLSLGLSAATRTWKGGVSTKIDGVSAYHASNAANWVDGVAPADGDDVVFDETATSDCRWNLGVVVANWTQATNFTKTVTLATTYGDALPFVSIAGNVDLQGGTWTHVSNGNFNRTYRLYVKVGGAMTVGANAKVSANGLGYSYTPNTEMARIGNLCGSHGGFGNSNGVDLYGRGMIPYGSVVEPEEPGGGGNGNLGGGAVRLEVAGALVVDGALSADGKQVSGYVGAGGSVYVRAGSISGAGSITADGIQLNTGTSTGSGGRVSVVLTGAGADFSQFDPLVHCSARGRNGATASGAATSAGTVYAETAADVPGEGWLILRGSGYSSSDTALQSYTPVAADGTGLVRYSRLTVTNKVYAYVGPGVTFDARKTVLDCADTDIQQNGFCVAGGTLMLADGFTLPCKLIGRGGTVDCKRFVFASGSKFFNTTAGGLRFTGDVEFGEGASAVTDVPWSVDGDLTVDTVVTHQSKAAIEVDVGGDCTISATGGLSGKALGYPTGNGPANIGYTATFGGVHAARSWSNQSISSATAVGTPSTALPYDSIRSPSQCGGGGGHAGGGGVVRLTVGGALEHDGTIDVSGASHSYTTGAGGAVAIVAGSLSGTGEIRANGGFPTGSTSHTPGTGGRIAVRLTDAQATFADFRGIIEAMGGRRITTASTHGAGAGTIWLCEGGRSLDEGDLVIDNTMSNSLHHVGLTYLSSPWMPEGEESFRNLTVGPRARVWLPDGGRLNLSGSLSNGCEFVAGEDSTVALVGTETGRFFGDVTLVNVACAAPGKTIEIEAGRTLTATGVAAFSGSSGTPLTLRGTDGGSWTFANAGVTTMEGVALGGCTATAPLTVVNGQDLGGNSDNVTFVTIRPGATITWTGANGTDVNDAANWDLGRAPINTDCIVIPGGCARYPVLAAALSAATLSVGEGASLDLGIRALSVTGAVSVAGALAAGEGATMTVGGDLTLSGTFVAGLSTVRLDGAAAQTLTLGAAVGFHRLEFLAPSVTVVGNLTADELYVGDGVRAFDCAVASGATVSVGMLEVLGDAGTTNGVLRCAEQGGQWMLNANMQTVVGTAVSGSDASMGAMVVPTDCRDDGDNVNWLFVDTRTHWDGTSWSDGEPTAEKDAVVDAGATLVVDTDFEVRNLSVAPTATLKVSASLTAAASVVVEPNGTLEWNRPGTIGGNLTLLPGAKLTHAANATTEANKIDLTVAGGGYVAAGAFVDACGLGYSTPASSPGGGKASGRSGSYGGRGYIHHGTSVEEDAAACYGSIVSPTNCGSCGQYGGNRKGGGAVRLAFGGVLTVDGTITADGHGPTTENSYSYGTGSGGSIWLTASKLIGTGIIRANGGTGATAEGGGGGRVAIHLTADESISSFTGTLTAHGGLCGADTGGSPGTIYIRAASGAETLLMRGKPGVGHHVQALYNRTELPPSGICDCPQETRRVSLFVADDAYCSIMTNTEVKSVTLETSNARIYLYGHTLRVRSPKPRNWNDAQVVPGDGGEILWNQKGFQILVR